MSKKREDLDRKVKRSLLHLMFWWSTKFFGNVLFTGRSYGSSCQNSSQYLPVFVGCHDWLAKWSWTDSRDRFLRPLYEQQCATPKVFKQICSFTMSNGCSGSNPRSHQYCFELVAWTCLNYGNNYSNQGKQTDYSGKICLLAIICSISNVSMTIIVWISKKKIAKYKNVAFTYSFVMGIWPDSMLAQTSIFPQANAIGTNNYRLALFFKCVEGGFEAGPQLVIQTWSIFLDQSAGMFTRWFCYKLWPI